MTENEKKLLEAVVESSADRETGLYSDNLDELYEMVVAVRTERLAADGRLKKALDVVRTYRILREALLEMKEVRLRELKLTQDERNVVWWHPSASVEAWTPEMEIEVLEARMAQLRAELAVGKG